jgi:hypothetical protein
VVVEPELRVGLQRWSVHGLQMGVLESEGTRHVRSRLFRLIHDFEFVNIQLGMCFRNITDPVQVLWNLQRPIHDSIFELVAGQGIYLHVILLQKSFASIPDHKTMVAQVILDGATRRVRTHRFVAARPVKLDEIGVANYTASILVAS